MDVSKLTIDPQNLRFNKMSNVKRTELRRRNLIDLIKNTPAGTPISYAEFAAVGSFKSSSANSMVKTLVKTGRILRVQGDKPGVFSYTVNDARVTKPTNQLLREVVSGQAVTTPPMPLPKLVAPLAIAELAKEFAWEHNTDSLRDFIAWHSMRK